MRLVLLVGLLLVCTQVTVARVELPALIGNHAVLQQKSKVKLWGKARAGAKVLVTPTWTSKIYITAADSLGYWKIVIKTPLAGGPYSIGFNDADGEVIITDVMLGEVWLASGQSNMVMPLKGYDKGQNVYKADSVIACADNYTDVRLFNVPKLISATPQNNTASSWMVSGTENAPEFSAVAYQFALQLHQKLKVPVGVITACWGSTAIQSWMSEPTLRKFPEVVVSTRTDTMKIPANDPEAVTAVLFNGMIAPLAGFHIKGFIWYQGESNKKIQLYTELFPAMVHEWRKLWGNLKMPFYYVQIAPWNYQGRNAALMREAQLNAKIPHSGMVVTLDAGQKNRIHPPNKLLIGTRLANMALARTYKQKYITYKSPEFVKANYSFEQAQLIFKNTYKGLHYKNDTLPNFEIAGTDHVFYPAKATICNKNKVIVQSDRVSRPVAVRYAFKSWAEAELFNSELLPASSFRTDNYTEK